MKGKILRNTGAERVIDLIRPWLKPGNQMDVVTPARQHLAKFS